MSWGPRGSLLNLVAALLCCCKATGGRSLYQCVRRSYVNVWYVWLNHLLPRVDNDWIICFFAIVLILLRVDLAMVLWAVDIFLMEIVFNLFRLCSFGTELFVGPLSFMLSFILCNCLPICLIYQKHYSSEMRMSFYCCVLLVAAVLFLTWLKKLTNALLCSVFYIQSIVNS